MVYDNVFDLLRAVRSHTLRPGESFYPSTTTDTVHIGFSTVDGPDTLSWLTPMAPLMPLFRSTRNAQVQDFWLRFRTYIGRKELLPDLLSGTVDVDHMEEILFSRVPVEDSGPVTPPIPQTAQSVSDGDATPQGLADFMDLMDLD